MEAYHLRNNSELKNQKEPKQNYINIDIINIRVFPNEVLMNSYF